MLVLVVINCTDHLIGFFSLLMKETAVHLCAKGGKVETLRMLLELGASLNAKDKERVRIRTSTFNNTTSQTSTTRTSTHGDSSSRDSKSLNPNNGLIHTLMISYL